MVARLAGQIQEREVRGAACGRGDAEVEDVEGHGEEQRSAVIPGRGWL